MTNELVERYVRVWNLASAEERRTEVSEIWAPGAVQYTPENRHDDLYKRVTDAYEELVAEGKNRFVPTGTVHTHHDSVLFTVDMIATATGERAWRGEIFLLLDAEGRVRLDYQYNLT
jgi:ribosomal protein S18 acetylase RimI-like enzyme